ncbi:hypothetical protein FQR65_LT06873 [Abscondita terminalis]|nr:hypothetical protein FQR65_LT06873 [Abscondita terminalis]
MMEKIVLTLLLATSNSYCKLLIDDFYKQSWYELAAPFFTECACITDVPLDLAYRLFFNTELPDNSCLKCFIKCIAEKTFLIDLRTGEWIEQEMVRQIEGITPDRASNCYNITHQEIDPCQKAYKIVYCIVMSVAVAI